MKNFDFEKLTTSGDKEARILLNSFFASFFSFLYIAFDKSSSFTLSGISSPIVSESKATISAWSLSKAIFIGVSSFSSVADFASTLQKAILNFWLFADFAYFADSVDSADFADFADFTDFADFADS